MTVYLVISLPKIPYIHRVYRVLANPKNVFLCLQVLIIAYIWMFGGRRWEEAGLQNLLLSSNNTIMIGLPIMVSVLPLYATVHKMFKCVCVCVFVCVCVCVIRGLLYVVCTFMFLPPTPA